MKLTARLAAATDSAVTEFAKRLHRKRGTFNVASNGTARAFFYQMGADALGDKFMPEVTLAMCCKEALRAGACDSEEQLAHCISLVEYRVFGKNCDAAYPSFATFVDWLAWKLPEAHPKERLLHMDGWNKALYQYAVDEAPLAFT